MRLDFAEIRRSGTSAQPEEGTAVPPPCLAGEHAMFPFSGRPLLRRLFKPFILRPMSGVGLPLHRDRGRASGPRPVPTPSWRVRCRRTRRLLPPSRDARLPSAFAACLNPRPGDAAAAAYLRCRAASRLAAAFTPCCMRRLAQSVLNLSKAGRTQPPTMPSGWPPYLGNCGDKLKPHRGPPMIGGAYNVFSSRPRPLRGRDPINPRYLQLHLGRFPPLHRRQLFLLPMLRSCPSRPQGDGNLALGDVVGGLQSRL